MLKIFILLFFMTSLYAGLTSLKLKYEDIKCKHLFIAQKKHANVVFFHNIDDKVTQGIYINLLRILNGDPFKQRNCFNKIYVMKEVIKNFIYLIFLNLFFN